MDSTNRRKPARGAALPLAMILLGVLTVIGVAAVSLSRVERQNAASYSRVDFVTQCANAAQAKLWAEMARSGPRLPRRHLPHHARAAAGRDPDHVAGPLRHARRPRR